MNLKRTNYELSQWVKYLGIAFVVLSCALWYLVFVVISQPEGRLTCDSFGSYGDIPSNWKQKLPWLDAGKKDGIPCNTLYKKSLAHA